MKKYILLAIIGILCLLLIPKTTIDVTEGTQENQRIFATGLYPSITITNYSLLPTTRDFVLPNFHKELHFTLGPFEKEHVQLDPDTRESYTFVFFSDSQPESGAQQTQVFHTMIEKINDDNPLFVVGGGDFVCEASTANFTAFLNTANNLHAPLFFVRGNHDIMDDPDLYEQYLGPRYYSFTYGSSLFVVLDNATGFLDAEQLEFLRTTLQKERNHVFIFMHMPPFDPRPGGTSTMIDGEAFRAIVQDNHVDYVFCGHIHSPYKKKDDNTTYVISGGAGAPLLADGFYHYVKVTVDDTVDVAVVRCEDG